MFGGSAVEEPAPTLPDTDSDSDSELEFMAVSSDSDMEDERLTVRGLRAGGLAKISARRPGARFPLQTVLRVESASRASRTASQGKRKRDQEERTLPFDFRIPPDFDTFPPVKKRKLVRSGATYFWRTPLSRLDERKFRPL
jgi:hypothetical protein